MLNKLLSNDTIAAPITSTGGSVCLIRLSGSETLNILRKIFTTKHSNRKAPNFLSHRLYYGNIINSHGAVVDEVLVSVMLAPKSFTRENVAEIGCHGGIVSAQAVLSLILQNGARLAEPGEFTKRAFLNGRIDISQAEASASLISAKSAAAHRMALSGLSGGLSAKIKNMCNTLLSIIARIEAAIDYPEHEDEIANDTTTGKQLASICTDIENLLEAYNTTRILREGINIAILGKPNAGKSSLLNALLNENRAIVTDIPGTTRDILKEQLIINDIPVNIADTAGIRKTDDTVELIGVQRAVDESKTADLLLLVVDNEYGNILPQLANISGHVLAVINKIDSMDEIQRYQIRSALQKQGFDDNKIAEVSSKNLTGVAELKSKIRDLFVTNDIKSESALIGSERQMQPLASALKHLQSAIHATSTGLSDDFLSIDITAAYHSLGEITGETLAEDIIDKIFAEFCLGK